MSIESILFFVLGIVGIGSAIMMITRANPVNSALFLVLNFLALSGIYLTLHAQFVAIIQVIVYAGAIMVLVLFVIMLLNLQDDKRLRESRTWKQYLGVLFGAVLLLMLVQVVMAVRGSVWNGLSPESENIGKVEHIGMTLFTEYLFPFEMTAILLLAAMVGAIVLAKKRFP